MVTGENRITADRMWRDAETRRRFEAETGLAPLAIKKSEAKLQAFEGHTQNYHNKFSGWALKQIDNQAAEGCGSPIRQRKE